MLPPCNPPGILPASTWAHPRRIPGGSREDGRLELTKEKAK